MNSPARAPTDWTAPVMQARIRRRYARERGFRALGLFAVLLSAGFLAFLLVSMLAQGARGFTQTELKVPIDFPRSTLILDPATLKGFGVERALATVDLEGVLIQAVEASYGKEVADLGLSDGAWLAVREAILDDPGVLDRRIELWVPTSTDIDLAAKGKGDAEAERLHATLAAKGVLRTGMNTTFLTAADSTDPTLVGIWGALKGSLITMVITLAIAFPIGVLTALYLEEYAPKNRWTDLIEVDQQPRRGALDHLRPARARGVPQLLRHAALGPAGRRPDARADDDAGDRDRRAQRDQVGAAVHPRRGARRRRVAACRWCSTMCCRWPCPASSPARSSAWRARWARRRRC
jgi:hypothetical protein